MDAYEACYAFTPDEAVEPGQRPSKRRKTALTDEKGAANQVSLFSPLFKGTESPASVKYRMKTFDTVWLSKETLINNIVHATSHDTVQEIASFIQDSNAVNPNGKIQTGLVVTGPDIGTSNGLFESVTKVVNVQQRAILINLSSEQSPNLKAVLKYINQHGTNQSLEFDEDIVINEAKGGRHLSYDLQILYEHVQGGPIDQVVIGFRDSEAFETKILIDLIDVLSCWNGRIPFVILFSIATSVDVFQNKLSRDAIRRLEGAEFKVGRVDVEEIFRSVNDESSTLWFGAGLSHLVMQRQTDYVQSPYTLRETVKYAYMTHFYANPLSNLLAEDPSVVPLQKEHFEAVRNLPSFRSHARKLIEERDYDSVRNLLDDDESLNDLLMWGIESSRDAIKGLVLAVNALYRIQSLPACKIKTVWSELYMKAMSRKLFGSTVFEEILNSVRKLPSDTMCDLLNDLAAIAQEHGLKSALEDLNKLTSNLDDSEATLRSQYDVHHETLRTTVVAQKVSLSKNTANLSAHDAAYTKIVDRISAALQSYFEKALIDPQELFLHEILIYDSKSPHREVFSSRPRFAIERALSSPHDYLGCECCGGAEEGLSATQPATALLYQLYLESGSVINTADLWSAFWTIVGAEGSEEDDDAERERVLALFSRALAELKYMGMVKNSRKKADHLAKLSWKGL